MSSAFSCSTSASSSSSVVWLASRTSRARMPTSAGRLVLEANVDLGGGILTDEDGGKANVSELADLLGDLAADALGERLAVHELRCHSSGRRQLDVTDVEAERLGELDAFLEVFAQPPDVLLVHEPADDRALLRTPQRVLDENRKQPVRRIDQRRFVFFVASWSRTRS